MTVSKSGVEGSNPSSPARLIAFIRYKFVLEDTIKEFIFFIFMVHILAITFVTMHSIVDCIKLLSPF